MLQDPLNDAMATLKNAELAGKRQCRLQPASNLIGSVLNVMRETSYIDGFEVLGEGGHREFLVTLRGAINDCGVIKPRSSVGAKQLERFEARYLPAQNFGVLILTTTSGVVSNGMAKEMGVGGKLLAYVY